MWVQTCVDDEVALELRLEAEFGAVAAVAAVVDEDVVRAERREAYTARVAALRLRASLERDMRGRGVIEKGNNDDKCNLNNHF